MNTYTNYGFIMYTQVSLYKLRLHYIYTSQDDKTTTSKLDLLGNGSKYFH